VLVDAQAGLAFAAGSADRQDIRNALLALAKTAVAFSGPVIASTSASKGYSGPLIPPLRAVLTNITPIERRSMDLLDDAAAQPAAGATGRRTLVVAGLLTAPCVSFPVLSALKQGYRVRVVADAGGGLPRDSQWAVLQRIQQAGATLTSWLQVLLEFQRGW